MPNYLRLYQPGGTWFFTVNLHDRRNRLLVTHVALLNEALENTRARLPFALNAWGVLPEHIHVIWTLPPHDTDFPTRWRLLKTHLSKAIPATEPRSPVQRARNERGIWQRRYWEHLIRDENDYVRHLTYCYINPVKHGLVEFAEQWPHSTLHRDLEEGFRPSDWTKDIQISGAFGERRAD